MQVLQEIGLHLQVGRRTGQPGEMRGMPLEGACRMFKPVKCPPGCKYAMLLSGAGAKEMHCGYVLITDELRGCDPGPNCTRYAKGKRPSVPVTVLRKRAGPKFTWDEPQGRKMWMAGKSDREIADALGVPREKVAKTRRRKWSVTYRREGG